MRIGSCVEGTILSTSANIAQTGRLRFVLSCAFAVESDQIVDDTRDDSCCSNFTISEMQFAVRVVPQCRNHFVRPHMSPSLTVSVGVLGEKSEYRRMTRRSAPQGVEF